MYVLLQSTETEVLDIHPRVLCFHFGADVASSCCKLYLTNKSKDRVVFWIEMQQGIIDCTLYDGKNFVDPWTTKDITIDLHSVKREGYPPVVPMDTGRINIVMVTLGKGERTGRPRDPVRPTTLSSQVSTELLQHNKQYFVDFYSFQLLNLFHWPLLDFCSGFAN